MTESCLIGFDNQVAEAAITAGSAVAGMDAAKVQNRDLWDVWRSAGLTPAQTTLTAAFPSVVTVKLFGIFALNVSTAATWRITAKLDGAEVYDSGEIVLGPIVVAMADREWEDDNFWTGQMTEGAWQRRRRIGLHPEVSGVRADRFEIAIADADNPDGYLEVGRLFLGNVLQPTLTIEWGYHARLETRATELVSPAGHRSVSEPRPSRAARFTLPALTDGERERLLDLLADHGQTGEVVWAPFPDDAVAMQRESFLATIASGHGAVTRFPGSYGHTANFDVKEWV